MQTKLSRLGAVRCLFFKSEQFQLIDMPVQVGQSIDKHGHVKQAFTRIQKVRVEKPKQPDLFAVPEEPKKERSSRLDAFIEKHGGLARLAHLMSNITEGQQQKLFVEMGKLGGKSAIEVSAMFDSIQPVAASDDLFAQPEKPKNEKLDPKEHTIVEYTTRKGKVLRGIVRTDLTLAQAKEIDEYTFKHEGGYFIREKHLAGGKLPIAPQIPPVIAKNPQKTVENVNKGAKNEGEQDFSAYDTPVVSHLPFGVQAGISKQARRDLNTQAVTIVNRGAPFTEADKAVLRQYSGNGGCGDSLNEFYTLPEVASAMWSVAQRLGVKGDVLEPSCGPGVFLHTAPTGSKVTGVEMDETSAKIAKALHGDRHEIANASLERFATQDERQYDAVLGNVPFGLRGSLIKDDKPNLKTADAYFCDTSMDKCKAGGIVGLIVPTGIMDSRTNRKLRETLLRKGQFLGAQRMPNTAFEHSHTEVTTDVVWFRKFPDDVAGALSTKSITQDHLKTLGLWDEEFLAGSYFTGRGAPNVLGKMEAGWRAKAGMGNDITVEGSMRDVPEAIKAFEPEEKKAFPAVTDILGVVADEKGKAVVLGGAMNRPYADKSKVGDTKTVDDIAYVLQGKPPRWHRIDEVLQSEALTQGQDIAERIDALMAGLRAVDRPKLEADLRAWIEEHGIPSKNKDILLGTHADKTLHRLVGAVKSNGELSDLVLGKVVEQNKGSFEATIQSLLNDHETVGVDALSKAAELERDEALDQLFGSPKYAIDPATDEWTTKDIYLSGDLWAKLDAINAELNSDHHIEPERRKKFEQQIALLTETIAPVSLEDAFIELNSAFIPTSVISAFLDQRYKAHNTYDKNPTPVVLEFGEGVYTISGGSSWAYGNLLKYLNRDGLRKDDKPAIDEMNVEFKDWLCASPEYRDQIEDLYNRKFRGYQEREYSTEPMDVPGMNTNGVKPHIWSGLRWALSAGKGIIADDVGLGKTLEGILLAKMLKLTGQSKRPMIVCPKSVLSNWMAECEKWFPGSKVMAIGLQGDTEAKRNQKLHDLQQNDYDFILCPEPAFEKIALDPTIKGELNEKDFWNQRGKSLDKKSSKQQEKIRSQWQQALAQQEFSDDKRTKATYFNELGVDAVIADEVHHAKNLTSLRSRFGETPKYMGGGGLSMRALDFNLKSQWIRGQNNGKNVYGLSATPLKNSPIEIYAAMSHVAPELMENIGIRNSEEFIDRFAKLEQGIALTTAGAAAEAQIVSGFQNMDELRTAMKRCIHRRTAKDVGLKLPERQDITHMVTMDADQEAKYVELRELALASGGKDATGDAHIFSIMDKMNKTAADLGLLDSSYDSTSPKYVECAKTIVQNMKDGGQIVFSDYNESHEKIAAALVAAGIPRDQIGILNGAETPSSEKRQKMCDLFNEGKLKVVIGNTAVMGEGLNLQKGTSDIHHLDLPWEPASMQQRNGRGLRQGNTNLGVRIHTYLAKGSFDGYRLQSILGKKDVQDMIWNGDNEVENLNQKGNVSRDEMMIMLSADPDAARAVYENNSKAKEERLIAGKTLEAATRFAKFQELKRSYGALENKGTQSATRLKVKLDKEKSILKADKYFTAKQALDIDTPVIVASTGTMLHDGVGIEVGDGKRYIITGVNQRGQTVTVRKYGDESQRKREIDVKELINPKSFAYNSDEETAEINKRIAEKPLEIKNLSDVYKLPASVISSNYDKLQSQIWEGVTNYEISLSSLGEKIPMLNKATGKAEITEYYNIGVKKDEFNPEKYDFLLPTEENKAKLIEAWKDAERNATFNTKYIRIGNRRNQTFETHAVRSYRSSLDNDNPWSRTVEAMSGNYNNHGYYYGGGYSPEVKPLREQLQHEQLDRVRHAKTFADALHEAASLGEIVDKNKGYSAKVKLPKRVIALLWAKAKHEGLLGSLMNQHNPKHRGYYVGGGERSVHSALLQMAVNSGHEDLAHAMVESGLRHHPDGKHDEALQVLAGGSRPGKDRILAMQKLADKAGLLDTARGALYTPSGGAYGVLNGNYATNTQTVRDALNEMLANTKD